MTREQRETIREVIGHLWTIEQQAGRDTMSGNYAEILTDMLTVDATQEDKEMSKPKYIDADKAIADYAWLCV